jgi:opacity protein-like surface antigen
MHRVLLLNFVYSLAAPNALVQFPPPSSQTASQFPEEPVDEATARGKSMYLEGNAGYGSSSNARAPFGDIEFGVRLSDHLTVFGAYGLYRNVQPSTVQPYIDAEVSLLARENIRVTGEARVPAQYALGGFRVDLSTPIGVRPYALSGIGYARSSPTGNFTYAGGSPTIRGGIATAGQDATNDVLSTNVFTGDQWNALVVRWGAGVMIPVGKSLFADVGYAASRVAAPTPFTVQGVKFGFAVRF